VNPVIDEINEKALGGAFSDNFFGLFAETSITSLLPEIIIFTILVVLLTLLALELGKKRSKKELALETIDSLRIALIPVFALLV
jgi:uncharacterized protein YhhL (DUF1145 family)